MSVVSDIEIRLRADIARLQQDMTQARQAVGGAMNSIRNAVGTAQNAIAGLAAAAGVAVFATFIKGAIDAVDAIGDISPATGVAIKDIAGLQLAFQFGGLEAGEFEKTMIKLSTSIAENKESIASLGIATRDGAGEMRASKDVLYDLADAFSEMETSTQKTALATEIFGKSGAMLIPMLDNGSEGLRKMAEMAEQLGLTFTEDGVEAAGQFNDSLDIIGLGLQGVGRQVAVEMLPTLNSLVGSFVDLMIKGDGVRKAADVIGGGFKIIYTGAVAVGQVFDTLSSVIAISIGAVLDGFGTVAKTLKLFIMGEYAAAWEAANAGARKTVGNVKNLAGDMFRSWSDSAAAIGGVWSGTSGETVAAMAAMAGASRKAAADAKDMEEANKGAAAAAAKAAKDAEKLAADQARAAERQAQAYAGLVESIEDRIYATGREAAGLKPLTDSQKMSRDLEQQLRTGKIELTAAQTRYAQSLIETLSVNEDLIDANEAQAAADKERARMLDEQTRAAADAIREQQDEQKRFWDSIDKTAHDTFVSIVDGGKGAAERLKETFKNIFFEWLYQQTIKKWIVNVQASTSGESGLFSDQGGASGGTDWMSVGKKIYDGFSKGSAASNSGLGGSSGGAGAMGGAASTAAAWLMAAQIGIKLGNKISSGYSVRDGKDSKGFINFSTLSNTVPILGGIVGGIINRAFGRRPREYGDSMVTGRLGSDGITGGAVTTNWTQKGGWFKSDKRGTEIQAINDEMAKALVAGLTAVKDAAQGYASALGVSASTVAGYSKELNIALTKDEAKNKEMLESLFGAIGDELALRVVPGLAAFQVEGEALTATLQRITANFQVVDVLLSSLSVTSEQAFGAVGVASIDARERLVELSGGIESLAAQSQFFADNFLTDAQRIAPAQKLVTEQLAALGYTGVQTVDQFRAAVLGLAESGRLATEEGARTYAGLLALAPAFKAVTDAAKAAEDSLADTLRSAAGAAFDALSQSIDARKGQLQKSFDEVMSKFDRRIDASNGRIGNLQSLRGALSGAADGMGVDSTASRRQAQAQIGAALAIARASGVLPGPGALEDALRAVRADAGNEFGSLADFQRDQLRTANQITELAAITDTQLGVEERTLQSLLDQKSIVTAAYVAEVQRLDGLLASAQSQVNAINGTTVAVLGLHDALKGFGTAMTAALGNKSISGQASVTAETRIESLYSSILGRGSDAGGLKYWSDALKAGTSMSEIAKGFYESTEYRATQGGIYTAQQGGTMGGGSTAMVMELQTLNKRMEGVETKMSKTAENTQRFADQFDNSTGGGGPLLVKTT